MNSKAIWASPLGAMVLVGVIWGCVVVGPTPARAQKPPAVGSATNPAEVMTKPLNLIRPGDQDITSIDAQRGALDRFLDTHPEIGEEVVRRPTAMSDPNFLHDHPEMQAFLESHPQVKADPRAFVSAREWRNEPPRSELAEFMSDLAPLAAFVCALLAILWVIRTFLENRRWNRSFKMHEEVHTKLIEKFASGQDFNAYMQSEGGRRLLEWTPPTNSSTSRGLPNPIGRIFWSLQGGLVLALMGIGLLLLRSHMTAGDEPPLLVFGTLGVTLGAGFILSAVVSYGLSRHLGIIDGTAPGSDSIAK
jgi:hypothetical protein